MAQAARDRSDLARTRLYEANPLDGYEDDFLDCRGLSHSWTRVGFFSEGAWVSQLARCQRCGCQKVQTMSRRTGELMRTRYEHPQGYLVHGSGGVSKAEVRKETLRRAEGANIYSSAEELMKAQLRRLELVGDR